MRTYKDKEELKNEINKSFEKYISEFDNIPESLKDKRIIEVDRTPAENLAYQVGWTTLVLKWEDDEKQGIEVKTPSDMFKWNQLGELYQWFTDTYSYLSLAELKDRLKENITSMLFCIELVVTFLFTLRYDIPFIREMRKSKVSRKFLDIMAIIIQMVGVVILSLFVLLAVVQ